MEQHALINSYRQFVKNRTPHKIGVIGQPDAGKSSLINALLPGANAHTSVHTDATLEVKAYPYHTFGELIDFPGVGTEEVKINQYKKMIQKSGIETFLYVMGSKIKETDVQLIRYLAKEHKDIIFVYNKSDTLVDVTNKDSVDDLKRDKNTELQVLLKKYVKAPLSYVFVSALTNEGIQELNARLQSFYTAQQKRYEDSYRNKEMLESYLNYKTNTVLPKLFTPSFKEVIIRKNYTSLERTILNHFKIQEDDVIEIKRSWPSIQSYIESYEAAHEDTKFQLSDITKLIQLMRTALKIKSINPITAAAGALLESGINNAFPIFQAITKYISDIEDIARQILLNSQPNDQ